MKVSCFPRIISIRWVPGMVLIKSKSMLGRDVFVLNHFDPTIIFADDQFNNVLAGKI